MEPIDAHKSPVQSVLLNNQTRRLRDLNRYPTEAGSAVNPYVSTLQTQMDTAPRVIRNATFFGGVTGVFVWFTLFLAVGFDSDFGNKLTRLYGRDLTGVNYDWMIFAVIVVAPTTLSFTLSGVATRSLAATSKAAELPLRFPRNYLISIPPATVLLLIAWICRFIDTPPAQPVAYSVLAATCCSWAFSSAILSSYQQPQKNSDNHTMDAELPTVRLQMDEHSQRPSHRNRYPH